MRPDLNAKLDPVKPVLIAGPTASGKSSLALEIAEAQGRSIVNADASQVYSCWRVLSARPSVTEESQAPHHLFGHLSWDAPYSAGHWLREVTPLLTQTPAPVIVGGTGLYFLALTEGLAEIPSTPANIRKMADAKSLDSLLDELDTVSRDRIDLSNRARVQRAWEVLQTTGRGIANWQDLPATPDLRLGDVHPFAIDAPKAWLTPRIEARADIMLRDGALEEVAAMEPHHRDDLPAFRVIGIDALRAHLNGDLSEGEARERLIIATRQYAKRQRTWLRKRMQHWDWFQPGN